MTRDEATITGLWLFALVLAVVIPLCACAPPSCRAPASPRATYECCYQRCFRSQSLQYRGNQVTLARECQALCRGHVR